MRFDFVHSKQNVATINTRQCKILFVWLTPVFFSVDLVKQHTSIIRLVANVLLSYVFFEFCVNSALSVVFRRAFQLDLWLYLHFRQSFWFICSFVYTWCDAHILLPKILLIFGQPSSNLENVKSLMDSCPCDNCPAWRMFLSFHFVRNKECDFVAFRSLIKYLLHLQPILGVSVSACVRDDNNILPRNVCYCLESILFRFFFLLFTHRVLNLCIFICDDWQDTRILHKTI